MKKAFFALVAIFGFTIFTINNANAQIEEVVIHGWKPWMSAPGGNSGSGSGSAGNGYEPNETNSTTPKVLRTYTRLSSSGKRFQVTEYDDNGEWVIAAKEIQQPNQPYARINISQTFESWEAFAANANSVTWCREWIESEEKTLGLSGTVKGEAGTPFIKGGAEVTSGGSSTKGKQLKNTQCATQEQ